jgi:hypothetical protein
VAAASELPQHFTRLEEIVLPIQREIFGAEQLNVADVPAGYSVGDVTAAPFGRPQCAHFRANGL